MNCHAELVSASYDLGIPNGKTLTPTLSHRRGSKYAFTLAETLITLVIVGVIAAITVPTLITKYQKEQTVTKLKKIYSTLQQTTNRAIADNGPIKSWTIESGKPKEFVEQYLLPYLSVQRICGYQKGSICDMKMAYLNDPKTYYSSNTKWYKVILQDGTFLMFNAIVSSSQFGSSDYGSGATVQIPRSYLAIEIDINGAKGPNIMGKDWFEFNYFIQNDFTPVISICTEEDMEECKATYKNWSGVFIPNGGTIASGTVSSREDYKNWGCNKNGTGAHCAGLIMADGWRIADDYPW